MKLGSILAKVGVVALKNVIPGSGIVIDAVNAFLPEGSKLPGTATGSDITAAVNGMSSEDQASVLEKEFDVEIVEAQEWTKVIEANARVDMAGASTRPEIAKMMANLVTFEGCLVIIAVAYSAIAAQSEILDKLNQSWPLLLAIMALPVELLRAYFGMRTKEKKARLEASGAPASPGLMGTIAGLFKKP